jgi:hypothetical protein
LIQADQGVGPTLGALIIGIEPTFWFAGHVEAPKAFPSMPPPQAEPLGRFSPDGRWWFDGSAWRPTRSPDGLWRWNGQAWVPTQRRGLPRWAKVRRLVWLALLGLAPLLGLGSCATTAVLIVQASGGSGSCIFDPPPGDHFQAAVLNDTPSAVQVQGEQPDGQVMGVAPGSVNNALHAWCGETLRVWRAQRLLGCLDASSQDDPRAAPLRVSKVGAC